MSLRPRCFSVMPGKALAGQRRNHLRVRVVLGFAILLALLILSIWIGMHGLPATY
ncbi:MAG: hypothetical protein ACYDAG_04760 [Chloroflexota bacterium]